MVTNQDNAQKLTPFHETAFRLVAELFANIHRNDPGRDAVLIGSICVVIGLVADSALPDGEAGKLADAWADIPSKIRRLGLTPLNLSVEEITKQVKKLRDR